MIKCFYQIAASDQFIKQRRNAHSQCPAEHNIHKKQCRI